MKADILRKKFLEFFKARKHKIAESDSLVPKDDPTVLFTPAGMNQFKRQFLGQEITFRRAATSQRCLRTDDLEKVGRTCGHHTFFEMLGNFSFGDYFKKEAIAWAWEFLTQELKISPEKLWVSVYREDAEAEKIWREVAAVPQERIVKLGDKENFWPSEAKAKGPNGPCGPCSEIFFDFGPDKGCQRADCNPSCDCGRFVEIWNLVFTQFNRKENGALEPLPQKNIDTGMGLERLAAVMQGKENNFETDLFQPIIEEINLELSLRAPKAGLDCFGLRPRNLRDCFGLRPRNLRDCFGLRPRNLRDCFGTSCLAMTHAIADHLRAISFAIYDGVLPSNEARGYVIRKLIRKSAFHLKAIGIDKPFFYKLVPVLAQIMQVPYPELTRRREDIAQVILAEEKNFNLTLNASAGIIKEKCAPLLKKPDPEAAGRIVFQLYDTYGIPPELSKDWLEKNGLPFSQASFDKELEQQKNRSKGKSSMQGDVFSHSGPKLRLAATKFSGYTQCAVKAKVQAVVKEAGDQTVIVLDKTPFYPEGGGQVGDQGLIKKGKNIFAVSYTKKSGALILHVGRFTHGSLKKSDAVIAQVDMETRLATARNHTATHLLQAALRKALGQHVQQQGSLVEPERLRFDFSHFKALDLAQLQRIEEVVNGWVRENHQVDKKEMTLATAKKSGALAFFGEKYAGKVRVVSIAGISKELCGGIHLDYTGQIGPFRILEEGSVASGIRRIEAVTGSYAYKIIEREKNILAELSGKLNQPPEQLSSELEKLSRRMKELEKQLKCQKLESLKDSIDSLIQSAEKIKDKILISKIFSGLGIDLLRKNMDQIKEKANQAVIALGSEQDGRAFLVVGISADLVSSGLDAGKLAREVAGIIGGSGGGRSDFAQAGGNKPENLAQAIAKLKDLI